MKQYGKIIIGMIIATVLAVAIEFGIDMYTASHYSEAVIDMTGIEPTTNGSMIEYTIAAPAAKYREFRLEYDSESSFYYDIGEEHDKAFADRNYAITDLNYRGGDIVFSYDSNEAQPHITSVSFKTADGSFDLIRFFWILLLFTLIIFVSDKGSTIRNKQVAYVTAFGLIMGLMLISSIGFRQKGWDEYAHFGVSWEGSYIGSVADNDITLELRTLSGQTEKWQDDALSERESDLSGRIWIRIML